MFVADRIDESELRSALAEGRFELHYQPQYASREPRLVGVEALTRMRRRDGSLVPPDRFIATAERIGLIADIGLSVFTVACAQAARWPELTVAVNVSPAQFKDIELPRRLTDIVAAAGIAPAQIEIEITEGLLFDDPEKAGIALTQLHAAGFSIALDDFGTGYSSLGYLLRFPIKKIKIDRSFVRGLPDDIKPVTIVHAIVALGRALGMQIVAEGVETEAQRRFLATAGCHLLQGYLLSRPLPAEQITALLAKATYSAA